MWTKFVSLIPPSSEVQVTHLPHIPCCSKNVLSLFFLLSLRWGIGSGSPPPLHTFFWVQEIGQLSNHMWLLLAQGSDPWVQVSIAQIYGLARLSWLEDGSVKKMPVIQMWEPQFRFPEPAYKPDMVLVPKHVTIPEHVCNPRTSPGHGSTCL